MKRAMLWLWVWVMTLFVYGSLAFGAGFMGAGLVVWIMRLLTGGA